MYLDLGDFLTLADFVSAAYLKATGSVSTLTASDSDYIKFVQLANIYSQNWANEPGVDWVSLYNPKVSCGTVTATDTFNIASSVHKISQSEDDPVRIIWTNGTSYSDYVLVPADHIKQYVGSSVVSKVGATLLFANSFTATSNELGGTIYVPAYTVPATLASDSDLIAVDNPYWLVAICAAEYTRNNLVRQNQYPNLLAEANELMKKMVENNDAQHTTVIRRPVANGRNW